MLNETVINKIAEKILSLDGKTFLSKRAGAFSNVPQRTVQNWTEKGLLSDPGTTGTGNKRNYSVLNCIEIGLIKSLTEDRLAHNLIESIMAALRRGNNLKDLITKYEYAYYFIILRSGKAPKHHGYGFNESERTTDFEKFWTFNSFYPEGEKVIIVNLHKIAEKVLMAM